MSKKKKIAFIMIVAVIFTISMSTFVFASGSINPGVKFGNWLQTNVAGVFVGVAAVIGVVLLFSRQIMKAMIAFVFMGIGALFIFGGSAFGQKISNLINSWF